MMRMKTGRKQFFQRQAKSTALVLGMVSILLLAFGMPARGQDGGEPKKSTLYQWMDERGGYHVTDDPAKVPQKHRSTVKALDSYERDAEPSAQRDFSGQGAADEGALQGIEGYEEEQRTSWQERIRAAREKIAAAELRRAELERQRDELLQQWGGPASGRTEGRVEAAGMEAEIKTVQQEIDAARHELDVTIPEDARKAGVPPGWLRE